MENSAQQPKTETTTFGEYLRRQRSNGQLWLLLIPIGVVTGFYLFYKPFSATIRDFSALSWAWAACHSETASSDYAHGRFVPLGILGLLYYHRKRILAATVKPNNLGLILIALGLLSFVLSVRTLQPRVAVGGLPFLILGSSLYLWGPQVTKPLVFPVCLIYFAIPLPGLNQMTNNLQIFATNIAFHVSRVLGADVVIAGNNINSAGADWGFDIAEGCSGVRSLIALTLIAAVYAHLTQKTLWKKAIIFLSSVPLALIANGLRVTTIVLIAEYGDPDFAGEAYHNFSGFLFFPLGLIGLIIVDMVINRRIPFISRQSDNVTTIKSSTSSKPAADTTR